MSKFDSQWQTRLNHAKTWMRRICLDVQRRRREPGGTRRDAPRSTWERKTRTPFSSLSFSSWASPSFSFASPWSPSAIGFHPTVLSTYVSVPLWVRNLDAKCGTAFDFLFQESGGPKSRLFRKKDPNCRDPMPLSVPRLKILRLCWQHTSAHHCDQILLIKMSCVLNNEQSLLRVVAILCVLSSVLFSSLS